MQLKRLKQRFAVVLNLSQSIIVYFFQEEQCIMPTISKIYDSFNEVTLLFLE